MATTDGTEQELTMVDDVDRSFEYLRFRKLGRYADTWALTSEADVAKHIFAAIASNGKCSFNDLRRDVNEGSLDGWNAEWVARLARVLTLQPHEADLHEFAFDALKLALPHLPINAATLPLRRLLIEILLQKRDIDTARTILHNDDALAEQYFGYLGTDLINPHITGNWSEFETWLRGFNAAFIDAQLSPVSVNPESDSPFDSLASTVNPRAVDGPLVTVIVTTFNPDPVEIRTSVNSILQQTWSNLEVLLIDDHSEDSNLGVLEELAAEDDRVKLIRQPVNGGTYRARNTGIRVSTGKYVTGQDTDDWSHPERIARQVEALEQHPEAPGVTAAANRTDDLLNKAIIGNNPHRRCEVSLMLRAETARAIGGYLPVRKAADSEFRERLEAWWGSPVVHLTEPLYIIRMSPGSLSRADFRPGWSHHARRAFWSAYKEWHARAAREDLQIDAADQRIAVPATAPARIAGREWPRADSFDICLAADWRSNSAGQRAAVDELRALLETDLDVAILHFDTPWSGSRRMPRALLPEVQRLVTEGRIRRVFVDEEIKIDLLVVRDPAAVDYARRHPSSLLAKQVLVVGDGNPGGRDESLRQYDPAHAHDMARTIFGQEPVWTIPVGQDAAKFREQFELPSVPDPYPLVLDVERYSGTRLKRTGEQLVIGRHADNDVMEWPGKELLLDPYPTDGSIELRVLGDARGAVRVLGEKGMPPQWIHFRDGEIASDVFWRTIDAVVLYGGENKGLFLERQILEALTAGVPIVTDIERAELYGGAVLGAPPEDALERVRSILTNSELLEEHRALGRQVAENLSPPDGLREFIHRRLNEHRAGAERDV
ncbi:MAG: glycosyltransferase family 2 protein [Pseudoclavibacter sp.]